MTKIVEIIPDDAPDWVLKAIASGNLFRESFEREFQFRKWACDVVSSEPLGYTTADEMIKLANFADRVCKRLATENIE